jgi:hypothetical protein
MFEMIDNRKSTSLKVKGIKINKPETENISVDLGINFEDVVFYNEILTVYITSEQCQKIIDDNALKMYIALTLDIPLENISDHNEE